MNGGQDEPLAKRQQTDPVDTNGNKSAPAENLKAATLAEAQRFTEAATSHHPSHSIDANARVSSPDVIAASARARAPAAPSQLPVKPPGGPVRVPVAGPDYRAAPYQRDLVQVEIDGTTWPIIRTADDRRRYADYQGA
jgi:hypothetical protein